MYKKYILYYGGILYCAHGMPNMLGDQHVVFVNRAQ